MPLWTNIGALRMESGTSSRDTAWPMSPEKVEVVLAAFRRFEADDMTGFGALLDPDVGATAAAGWPEHGPWIGADALVTQLERIRTEWSEHRIAQVEVLAEKGEWVVIEYSWEAGGATSGIDTVFDVVGAFRVRNGLIAEAHYRWNRAEALKAAGLSEKGAHVVARTLTPEEAWSAVQLGFAEILDLRTGIERRRYGAPPGARPVSLAKHMARPEGPAAIYLCQHAIRSKATLRHGAAQVAGGFAAWKEAGLPVEEVDWRGLRE
jgi:rhodanese-related sulfurtransferase/ketosteroid isomerase-like protein